MEGKKIYQALSPTYSCPYRAQSPSFSACVQIKFKFLWINPSQYKKTELTSAQSFTLVDCLKLRAVKVSVPSGTVSVPSQESRFRSSCKDRITGSSGKRLLQSHQVQPETAQIPEVKTEPRNLHWERICNIFQTEISFSWVTHFIQGDEKSFTSSHQLSFEPFEMSDLLLWQLKFSQFSQTELSTISSMCLPTKKAHWLYLILKGFSVQLKMPFFFPRELDWWCPQYFLKWGIASKWWPWCVWHSLLKKDTVQVMLNKQELSHINL